MLAGLPRPDADVAVTDFVGAKACLFGRVDLPEHLDTTYRLGAKNPAYPSVGQER